MDSSGRRWAALLALALVVAALVLPVGAMFLRSFQQKEVIARDGRVFRAVGEVEEIEVPGRGKMISFATQTGAGAERVPHKITPSQVAEVRTVWTLGHYGVVLGEPRTLGLVRNSLVLAAGAVLVALILGLPLAWLLGRTDLPGRTVLAAFCLGPAILPPLFVAMGASRPLGGFLGTTLGLEQGTLQLASAMLVFGFGLFPLVVLLVARALADVPAGPWEAAITLGGRGAAFRRVVLPAVLPAVFGAATLVFVLAWSDFAVPDALGFMLPGVSVPVHVFPTEILLQWKQLGNTARAVATGSPFVLVTVVLLIVSLALLRRSPVVAGGEGRRGRPRVHLRARGRVLGYAAVACVLLLTFVLPLAGVASWAEPAADARAPDGSTRAAASRGSLFDFRGALDRTPGAREDLARWLKAGVATALLAMAVAVALARWAIHGGRAARATVLGLGAAPLAVPGLVLAVGTLLVWLSIDVKWVDRSIIRSVFALTARFLPFALLAAWLALREVRRGSEEAAALLGAGPLTRAGRIWGPLAGRGILGGGLVVLVLALREIDAVILVDPRIFPMRLYDKIHFSRMADEANLAFLYVGILLVPAVLAAALLGGRRWRT